MSKVINSNNFEKEAKKMIKKYHSLASEIARLIKTFQKIQY